MIFTEEENQAYWKWIDKSSFNLTKSNKEFQIKIEKSNILKPIDYDNISSYVERYYKDALRIINLPNADDEHGWKLYIDRRYLEALPYLKKMSKSADVLNAIAICYYRTFQYKKALVNINNSIEFDKDNPVLLGNKASILIEYGGETKNEKLIIEGLKIIESLMDNGGITNEMYFNYGNSLGMLGEHEAARGVYLTVIKNNPNKADAWKNLGNTYHNLFLFEKELECYDISLSIDPFLIEALTSKAITLIKVFEQYEESIKILMRVINIDKEKRYKIEYPYVDFYLAECYLKLGNKKQAKRWNSIGLKDNPTDDYFLNQKERLQ